MDLIPLENILYSARSKSYKISSKSPKQILSTQSFKIAKRETLCHCVSFWPPRTIHQNKILNIHVPPSPLVVKLHLQQELHLNLSREQPLKLVVYH